MSIRYRRRLTLFPGITLNFSKSGISTTFGIPGASVNVGKNGTYFNAGIPGTGIYSRTKIGNPFTERDNSSESSEKNIKYYQPLSDSEIRSASNESITSDGLKGLKETFLAALQEENVLNSEIKEANNLFVQSKRRFKMFKIIPFSKFILKKGYQLRENDVKEREEILGELKEQLSFCKVEVKLELNDDYSYLYSDFKSSYDNLIKSELIWDLVTQIDIDRYSTRSAAYQSVGRKRVSFGYKNIRFIKSQFEAFYLQNANEPDIYIYPGFIVLYNNKTDFALIDFKELNIDYIYQRFIEEENVPSDTQIIDKTWAKVNKNGSRDLRFKYNYQIPVVGYAKLHFTSKNGLNELYMFSNSESPRIFRELFSKYKLTLNGQPNRHQTNANPSSSEKINWAYNILGIKFGSSTEQIKLAYYDLIKKYHPDKVDGLADEFKTLAENKTRELNEAYKILLSN